VANILILGATGYIGRKLLPRLLNKGHSVRVLVRNPDKLPQEISNKVDITTGDVLKPDSLEGTFDGIDIAYYLVHSMGAGESKFESLDEKAAKNVSQAASKAGTGRMIYLGGLGDSDDDLSPHLESRQKVGHILREGSVPVTEFRAAVIVGQGSFSFEMVHHLVNRLPVMICPRWVITKTQPIAVEDVLEYLVKAIDNERSAGEIIDIGGPEILTYRDMMLTIARILNLKRYLIQVPVLTPRLSSYWVKLVTPVSVQMARAIIEGVRSETICRDNKANELFPMKLMSFHDAVTKSLEYTFEAPLLDEKDPDIDYSHFRLDERAVKSTTNADNLFQSIISIGGENGWYYADWLWKLRGLIDKVLGGVGLRRTLREHNMFQEGDPLDFWRIERFVPNRRLLLRAEMNVWGKAWLDFRVEDDTGNRIYLRQTAWYYPDGLFGYFYWYTIYPVHFLIFRGLSRAICRRAEKIKRNDIDDKETGNAKG